MSCVHYRTMDIRRDRLHMDFKYPHSCYTTACNAPTVKSPCFEVCGRGDPPFAEPSVRTRRIENAPTCEQPVRRRDSMEEMQARLKLLEGSNATMHLRNRNLIAENGSLVRRLEEDAVQLEKLRENVSLLQDELNAERVELTYLLAEQAEKKIRAEDSCTSSTNIVPMADCGIQVWEACKDCHGELEGCQREPPTVTITRSELELLERDMRTLRDAVIAREEAWDKATEREQNCRQQLARLTAETITTRHLCETHQDELRIVTQRLTERESELKGMQKETLYLNKLITKLHRYQKEFEERTSGVSFGISEKDQRYIEEIVQRIRSTKGKSKARSKYTSNKCSHSNSSSHYGSPRESNNEKDQAGSSEDHQN